MRGGDGVMIDLLIEAKVISRDWTFNQISDLKNTIEELSTELYSEMKLSERFELIRECPVNDLYVGQTFEDAFREVVMTILRGEVAGKIKNMLGKATINFGGKNEISERSMGRESHKERPSNEKEDSKDEE
ncbi:MAG: hypothetical protein GOVbin4206_113 [Prokaryotic dsDNA virus sp.]|nr:MAG: hypothetical protein GOVbin4206_113 [Prokaryotic dsDNA virus sp.]